MKEWGPNPHVPQAMRDLLSSRTDWTHQNPMLPRSSSGHWTHCWGASENVSAPAKEMIRFERLQRGTRTWSTISTLQINQSWKQPSVQTRPVARIVEKRTGSSLLRSFPFSEKQKTLKKNLRQGKNYLVSSHNTYGDVLKLCVVIHHYQPLSELSWAHQLLTRCFGFFFYFFLSFLEQRVLLSSVFCYLK